LTITAEHRRLADDSRARSLDMHTFLADWLAVIWATEVDDLYSAAARVSGLLASLSRLAVVALMVLSSTRQIRARLPLAPNCEVAA
jgi:hypothetical protein